MFLLRKNNISMLFVALIKDFNKHSGAYKNQRAKPYPCRILTVLCLLKSKILMKYALILFLLRQNNTLAQLGCASCSRSLLLKKDEEDFNSFGSSKIRACCFYVVKTKSKHARALPLIKRKAKELGN